MLPQLFDRVCETSTTTGTGSFTLAGAKTSCFSYSAVGVANGDPILYAVAHQSANECEEGIGTWNTGGTITRTASGVLSGSAGAGTLVNFSIGVKDVLLSPPAALLENARTVRSSILVNPFRFAQLQARATLTSYATNNYTFDQWYLQHDTGGTNVQTRVWQAGDSSPPVAFPRDASYYGQLKNNSGSAAGILLCQPLISSDTLGLRGGDYVASIAAIASAGTPTLKARVFEWTGTVDSSSSKSLVASWSGNVPTFNTTTLANLGSASQALNTSAWSDLWLSVPVGSSANNLVVAIWVEGLAAGESLYLSKSALYPGKVPLRVLQKRFDEDLLDCERFVRKSYGTNAAPGTATPAGYLGYLATTLSSPSIMGMLVQFNPPMAFTPTVTTYDGAGTAGKVDGDISTPGFTSTVDLVTNKGARVYATTTGGQIHFHYTAVARI